ncbi:MAG: hypothetical protein ACFFFC_04520 [Candidatus Thorarchaeota archaeon]
MYSNIACTSAVCFDSDSLIDEPIDNGIIASELWKCPEIIQWGYVFIKESDALMSEL